MGLFKIMKKYFFVFLSLLVVEIAIAVFHFHDFIRGFVGDLLVVPLVYFFQRSITNLSLKKALLVTLSIAFLVEILQGFSIMESLGIQSRLLQIVLGSTFDPWDLAAYVLGIIPILYIEKFFKK